MLTTEEIRDHLEARSYMPGWGFAVYDGRFEGQHLVISACLPDSYNRGQSITVRVENMLPPIPDVSYLDEWMIWRLCRIATHEAREFYRDESGRAVFDPHAEFAERDLRTAGGESDAVEASG